jgi:hypothetical protein
MQAGERPNRRDREAQSRAAQPDGIAALRTIADSLAARSASLKKLADAAEPIYGTLDERQRSELFRHLNTSFDKRRR